MFIAEQQDCDPVRAMCEVLEVSRSGYYGWRKRDASPRAGEDQELGHEIERLYEQSGQRCGKPGAAIRASAWLA